MSEAESFGENRNSFVFPLTKMRRKLIISAGTLLDILPLDIHPDVHAKKQNKNEQTKHNKQKGAEVFKPQKSPITISISSWCAFQKLRALGAQVAAWPWPRFCAEERSPGAQWPERRSPGGSSPVAVVSSSSPRTGRARWTEPSDTRAWSGGRGLNAPSSFVGRQWFTLAPESSPH